MASSSRGIRLSQPRSNRTIKRRAKRKQTQEKKGLRGEQLNDVRDVKATQQIELKEVGQVTSSVFSETVGSPISLALIKYGNFDPGTDLSVQTSSDALEARVIELPFYKK